MSRARIVYGPGGRKQFFLGDREVTEAEFAASGRKFRIADLLGAPPGLGQGAGTTGWPCVSEAMAVSPKQVREAQRVADRHGLGVTYRPDGCMVIPDAAARKRAMRHNKFFCKDSFS